MDYEEVESEIRKQMLPGDASVDLKGRLVDKRRNGSWKAAAYILATETAERLAFYSVAANLVTYLINRLHEPLPKAVNLVTNWLGADYVLGLFGAFIADSYWGRYYTIAVFSCFYILGMGFMTLSATIPSLRPPACNIYTSKCAAASNSQLGFIYVGLYMIAVGTGGIKPCVSAFGADQFDEADEGERKSKYSFFNWFYFAINLGALFAITVIVYLQDNIGWGVGFGIPTAFMAGSLLLLLIGTPVYRHKLPSGSPFTRFLQVVIAATRNWRVQISSSAEHLYEAKDEASAIAGVRKLKHTRTFRFLDKAATYRDAKSVEHDAKNPWKLCTVTQVEELKLLLRLLPIIATTMFLWTGYAQILTFFVQQGTSLDRSLGSHFKIPAASLPIFAIINSILLLPMYDRVIVPFVRKFTGHERGFSPLQRMGIGLFFSITSMIVAALVERRRLQVVRAHHLLDSPGATVPMTIFWLAPQYFLVGTAEIFAYVGQLEFFYDEVSDAMRSLSTAVFLSELGIGSWISSLLVTLTRRVTGEEHGWIVDNLNRSRIDKFYWLLAVMSAVNFLLFQICAYLYRYKKLSSSTVAVTNVESDEDKRPVPLPSQSSMN